MGVVTVDVFAMPCGWLSLPRKWLFAGEEDSQEKDRCPDYAFHVQHPSGAKLMFDMGFNKNLNDYSKALQEDVSIVRPEVPRDAADILRSGGIETSDIDAIIYSHMHWDHIGDPRLFSRAEIVVGPGAKAASYPGWPERDGPFMTYCFHPPSGKVREMSYDNDTWTSWGPFERVHDYFGDDSFLLIDTPGHMPGHLGALARTGEDEYVFMGGDVCHARHFFSPCCGSGWDIGTTYGPGPTTSMHAKPSEARDSISKVALAHGMQNVFVAIAHDPALEGIIPEFPHRLNGWRERGDKAKTEARGATLEPRR